MALHLVTGPTNEPLTTGEAALHLKIDDGHQDVEIVRWIAAARAQVEHATDRKLHTQTWRLKMDRFPCGPIWLPFPPVTSVTSITYLDQTGATQTWSSALYVTDLPTGPKAAPARIVPAYSLTYPSTRDQINAVTVEFVCGYGEGNVPMELVQAMLLLMTHWNENRTMVATGQTTSIEIQKTFDWLTIPFAACPMEMR